MGYGSRALQLLQQYYEGQFPLLDEKENNTKSGITSVSSEVELHLQHTICVCVVTQTPFVNKNDKI